MIEGEASQYEKSVSDDQLRAAISQLMVKYRDEDIPTMAANYFIYDHIDGPLENSIGGDLSHPSFQTLVDRAQRLLEIMKTPEKIN